jgi:PAS domain-containing protein
MLRKFDNSDIEYFFSESDENGRYTFESDNFAILDGRDKSEISRLSVKDIRSDRVPQYIFDEMYDWSRNKGFWNGILENINGNGKSYWVKASVIKLSNHNGLMHYGMISIPASIDEIEKAKNEYNELKNIKYDKVLGKKALLYPLNREF